MTEYIYINITPACLFVFVWMSAFVYLLTHGKTYTISKQEWCFRGKFDLLATGDGIGFEIITFEDGYYACDVYLLYFKKHY